MTSEEIKRAKTLSSAVASIGKTSTPILKRFSSYMPTPEKEMIFERPESIASKLNSLPAGSLGNHLIKNPLSAKDVIEEIRKLSGNDRLDISNIRNGENLARSAQRQNVDMNDMRWHGGTSINSVASFVQVDVFNSTDGQTIFTATKPILAIIVFTISGANQTPITDYISTSIQITLTSATWPSGVPANQPVILVYIHG